jgi:hypothetical protein
MKKALLLVSLLVPFLTAPLFSQAADTRGLQIVVSKLAGPSAVIGKQYAVLIAIDKYRNWGALRNPVADANDIKDILSRRYFISDFMELYDEDATKAGIMKLFDRLITTTQPEDSVLIFYAGHGQLDKISNTGFWIPVDGGLDRFEQTNWLPNSQIRGLISNMKARHVALLADSCFSGDILNPTRGAAPEITNEYFKNAYSRVSRQVVTSGASEAVPDESSFARQLKLALEGNTSPYLDPLMLYNQIRLGVRDTTPLFGDLRDSGHQEGASFLLFLKASVNQTIAQPAAAPPQPQDNKFKVQTVYGKANVRSKTTGVLLLDGVMQGQVPVGSVATVENLSFGNHELEMQYENGETEKIPLNVDAEEAVSISFNRVFTGQPAQPAPAVAEQTSQDQAVPEQAAPEQAAPEQAATDQFAFLTPENQAVPEQAAADQAAPEQAAPEPAAVPEKPKEQLSEFDPLPIATMKIDGNFDDWNGILPALSEPIRGKGNLNIDKVFLAEDSKYLYVKFDIKDDTPSTLFHRYNFDTSHNSYYAVYMESGSDCIILALFFDTNPQWGNRWDSSVNKRVNGKWSWTNGTAKWFMKGSSFEAAFPMDVIRKTLSALTPGSLCKISAFTQYSNSSGKKVEGAGDNTLLRPFTF